jgi:hypothetical protein
VPGADPVAALTRYLTEGKTESARRLAEKDGIDGATAIDTQVTGSRHDDCGIGRK